ncbi:MAG: FKBP-type peptidyl-prolyl cis-trans isomerase [Deltaproteobacteria bacterium]|nr:FKBP-type peptidyl-prolyl cis-trans isomerase [Deltaproteobacteria bacterium]
MKVEKGKLVKIDYELAVKDGDVIESSEKGGPLEYEHGIGKMLPGLETRIEGLEVDDEKDGFIPAKEAYGLEKDLPTREIPAGEFPADDLEKGKAFEAKGADGNPVSFVVVDFDDDKVTVRFTHPLAGKDIRFKVKILSVRDKGAPPPVPPT